MPWLGARMGEGQTENSWAPYRWPWLGTGLDPGFGSSSRPGGACCRWDVNHYHVLSVLVLASRRLRLGTSEGWASVCAHWPELVCGQTWRDRGWGMWFRWLWL